MPSPKSPNQETLLFFPEVEAHPVGKNNLGIKFPRSKKKKGWVNSGSAELAFSAKETKRNQMKSDYKEK